MPATTRSREAEVTHEVAINRLIFKYVLGELHTVPEQELLEAAVQKEIQAARAEGRVILRESAFWLVARMGKLETKLAEAMREPKELVMGELSLLRDEAAMASYADKLTNGTEHNPLLTKHHDALARPDLFIKVAEVKSRFAMLTKEGDVEGNDGGNQAIVVRKLTEKEGKGSAAIRRDAADGVLRLMALLKWY